MVVSRTTQAKILASETLLRIAFGRAMEASYATEVRHGHEETVWNKMVPYVESIAARDSLGVPELPSPTSGVDG